MLTLIKLALIVTIAMLCLYRLASVTPPDAPTRPPLPRLQYEPPHWPKRQRRLKRKERNRTPKL